MPAWATSSDTIATWIAPSETATISIPEPRNGVIRWYDPITGRWLSNDPIGISGGLNQYVFVGNNPINFVDPFGLCEDSEGTGFMDWLHGVLDVGGTFEPTPFCDLGNALLYSCQGQWGYAGVSVAGVVPYLGDAAKLGKYGIKGAKGVRAITQKQAIHALERGEDVYAGSRSAAKQLQKKATGGAIEDPAHGADYYKHFHGKDREGGHAWFGEPQP